MTDKQLRKQGERERKLASQRQRQRNFNTEYRNISDSVNNWIIVIVVIVVVLAMVA